MYKTRFWDIYEQAEQFHTTREKVEQFEILLRQMRRRMENPAFTVEYFNKKLNYAMRRGFPVDFKDGGGWTLLMYSISMINAVNLDITKILLDYGADPNVPSYHGVYPVHLIIDYHRSVELLDTLLEAGADINAQRPYGSTAFSMAAEGYVNYCSQDVRKYYLDMCEALLDRGADPYLCDSWMEHVENDNDKERIRLREELIQWVEDYLKK